MRRSIKFALERIPDAHAGAFDANLARRVRPVVRALLLTGTVGYALFAAVGALTGALQVPEWLRFGMILPLLAVALATLRARSARALGLLGLAVVVLLEVGIFVNGYTRPQGAARILPAYIIQLEQRLRQLAFVDGLTGLASRPRFLEQARALLEASRVTGGALAALYLDADHFRRLNDQYSHAAGDVALGIIGDTLRQHLRPGDVVGRIGGEEFAILLPSADEATLEALLARADAALTAAKRNGRNRVERAP